MGKHLFCMQYLLLELLLRFANIGYLRESVNDSRNSVIVNMTSFSKHIFNSSDTLFFSLVCKHWSIDYISNSINMRNLSLPSVICLNFSPFVSFKTSFI